MSFLSLLPPRPAFFLASQALLLDKETKAILCMVSSMTEILSKDGEAVR